MRDFLANYWQEDDLSRNFIYNESLPQDEVSWQLKIKSDLRLAAVPFFQACFRYFLPYFELPKALQQAEGHDCSAGEVFDFTAPFAVGLQVERVALNLLHRASAIATSTAQVKSKIEQKKLKISLLETRKTTPGLRWLEKYAVIIGGGENHRMGQTDVFMIKDNHKTYFGSLAKAFEFFQKLNSFYTPVIAEVHSLSELTQAKELGIKHVMLDNFSAQMLDQAIEQKISTMTYEVSGGIDLQNIDQYLRAGIDAISMGTITQWPQKVDLSLKVKK